MMLKLTERIDFRNGVFGCAVSVVFLLIFSIVWLLCLKDVVPAAAISSLKLLSWFFALGLGGYAAVWKRKLTMNANWTSALVVGLLAELYLLANLPASPKTNAITLVERISDRVSELVSNPAIHWIMIIMLALSIPAAILGGALSYRSRSDEN